MPAVILESTCATIALRESKYLRPLLSDEFRQQSLRAKFFGPLGEGCTN